MKRTLLFVVVCLFFFQGKSFSQGTFLHSYSNPPAIDNRGYSVFESLSGSVLVAGTSYQSSFGWRSYVLNIDPTGNIIWTQIFDSLGVSSRDIKQLPDSSYIITGMIADTVNGFNVGLFSITKEDSLGNVLWTKGYQDSTRFSPAGTSLICTPNQGFLMVFHVDTIPFVYRSYIVKTDSLGNIQWSKKINIDYSDQVIKVFQTADGNYVLGGISTTIGGIKSPFIIKFDSTGSFLWTRRFNVSSAVFGSGFDVIEIDDRGLVINFMSSIIKTDSVAQVMWANSYNTIIYQLMSDSNGAIVGTTRDGLIKIDSSGSVQWNKGYMDQLGTPYGGSSGVKQRNGGFYFLISEEPIINLVHILLVRTDPNGGNCHEENIPAPITSPVTVQVDTPSVTQTVPYFITRSYTLTQHSGVQVNPGCLGLSTSEYSLNENLSISPNPSQTFFTITSSGSPIIKTEIHNLLGEKIYTAQAGNESLKVNCEAFPKGIYIATVTTEKETAVRKLVVQ